jgi:hypothetical protein
VTGRWSSTPKASWSPSCRTPTRPSRPGLLQGIAAAVATTVTLPYGALVGVLLYLDLRARKERLDLDTLKADLQASAA